MRRVYFLILLALAFSLGLRAQMTNNIPNYLYSGALGVGRNVANDANTYLQVGPNGSATKGVLLPRVADTSAISGTKRNGLLIYSNQLAAYAYYDSASVAWRKIGYTDTTVISTRAYAQNILDDSSSVLRALLVAIPTAASWGSITGTLSAQTDLQSALDAKQATLVSATNIKTINGSTLLGSGDLVVGGGAISALTAAAATNTIDNADYNQEWQWNSLTGDALTLSSTSTAGASSNKMLEILRSGANASSSIISYGLYANITNTGTSSTNYGAYFLTSGATNNIGVLASGATRGLEGLTTGAFGEGIRGSASTGSNTIGVVGMSTSASGTGVSGIASGTSGTKYGGNFTVSGTATTNYGVYATASGGTTNYGLYVNAGISSFQGSTNQKYVAKTANYTADATDYTILVDATSGAVTITLPAAAGTAVAGRIYIIKKTDVSGNAVTVDANGSETIDGATTYPLASQWKYVTIQSDGVNWFVIGNN
jgi:hypothetical protein